MWVSHLRKTLEPAWQRKYLDIPLSVAVDAISWHEMARAPQETMQSITLSTVQSMRSIINDTLLDVLYYRSPVYGQVNQNIIIRLEHTRRCLQISILFSRRKCFNRGSSTPGVEEQTTN